MADALAELYLLSAVLKRYDDDGQPKEDEVWWTIAPPTASTASIRPCSA